MARGLTVLARMTVIVAIALSAIITVGMVLEMRSTDFAQEFLIKSMAVLGIVAVASAAGLIAALAGAGSTPAEQRPARTSAPPKA